MLQRLCQFIARSSPWLFTIGSESEQPFERITNALFTNELEIEGPLTSERRRFTVRRGRRGALLG